MKLKFKVDGQRLISGEESFVVADSKNYLTAVFGFSQEWGNLQKSAIFKNADAAYTVVLVGDCCTVPYEVCGADFCVSVFGTNAECRITTNEVAVLVEESGYVEGETPQEPTATVYEQLCAQTAEAVLKANAAVAAVESKADASVVEADGRALVSHTENLQNPHSVTKEQLGLENVDNTSDRDKPVSDAVALQLEAKASQEDFEKVQTSNNSLWMRVNGIANVLTDLNRDYLEHVKSNDAAISSINEAVAQLDARHQSDVLPLSGQCNKNSENLATLTEIVGDIPSVLEGIIAMQNSYIGGDNE